MKIAGHIANLLTLLALIIGVVFTKMVWIILVLVLLYLNFDKIQAVVDDQSLAYLVCLGILCLFGVGYFVNKILVFLISLLFAFFVVYASVFIIDSDVQASAFLKKHTNIKSGDVLDAVTDTFEYINPVPTLSEEIGKLDIPAAQPDASEGLPPFSELFR